MLALFRTRTRISAAVLVLLLDASRWFIEHERRNMLPDETDQHALS